MKTLLNNFLTTLRRFRMATTLNILGLSIAFASFMLICMQIQYDLNYDNCHPDRDYIFRVEAASGGVTQALIARPFADAFTASSPHIVAGALVSPFSGSVDFVVESAAGERDYFTEETWRVTPDFTDVFTFDMYEGTTSSLEIPEQILIPRSMAQKFFGEKEIAVGKTIFTLPNNTPWTIGGVYNDFPLNSQVENKLYFSMRPEENFQGWDNWNYLYYIRVDNPKSVATLGDNFKRIFETTIKTDQLTWESSFRVNLTPLKDIHFTNNVMYDPIPKASYSTLLVLLAIAIAIAIIFIATINFTNFSTSLTPVRVKSINTQKILGANQRTLQLTLVSEAVFISLLAFLLAIGFVFLISKTSFTLLLDIPVTLAAYPGIIGITALLAVLTGIAAGIYPAFYTTSFSPALVLKGNFGLTPKGKSLRNALIGFQFIASFILIIASLVMFLQNRYMQNSPLGYEKEELIIAEMNNVFDNNWNTLENQLKAYAGIENVTKAESLLSSGERYMGWGAEYEGKEIEFQCLPVDPSFLQIMGIDLSEGRDFRKGDEQTSKGVFIFNEEARDKYNLKLGKKIRDGEIVGFIPNIKFASFRTAVEPMAFYVWGTDNWGTKARFIYIKTKKGADLWETKAYVDKVLKTVDPAYRKETHFYDEVLNRLYIKEQNLTWLITIFSMLAVFISIAGVFGLVIFESEYRRKEIGIRKVLGSTTQEVLLMFNKIYMRILSVCFIIAVPLAWYGIHKWLENFAYKTPVYWWIYALAFMSVAFITSLTVTYQNWRTANQNPVESLKNE